MQIDPVRLHRQSGHDRVAVVSLEPASTPGTVLVRVARGPSAAQLGGGTSYGPYPADQAQEPFALAVQQLKDEGFAELVPGWDLITALKGGDPAARCRAALRCAWRGKTDAADALHAAAEAAVAGKRGEACLLVESLARLGDPRALPLAIALAEKKNLSRRRSGVEALRLLHGSKALPDDARDTLRAALAAARQRGLQRLPPAVAEVLGAMDEESRKKEDVKALVKAALAGDPRRLGLVADVLYEAGTPVTVGAARRILARAQIERPHVWRYAKSVLKRAMLRRDAKTFGFLAHAVEHAALTSPGATANLKSGWDGKKKPLSVFSPKTQQYVRRACWRHLRDLARHQPAAYARTAAEVLVHYSPKDLRPPKGLVGAYGRCYLLGRVLFGGGERLVLDRKLRWRYRSPAVVGRPKQGREESFPALWDAGREAYLRVLTGAKLPDVFHFGLEGLERHPELLRHASLAQLLGLLGAPEEFTAGTPLVEKVCAELDRRFDPARPDLGLLARLLMHPQSGHPAVRAIAQRWLDQSAPTWTREERSIFQLPLAVDPVLRDHVARTLVEAFRADPALRAAHAEGFLAILKQPDEENRHGGFAGG
ncbi:MAG TPA: hypothetical protein RMH80_26125, partial [Polyangiaceae bacterium LLY-WYZ-15_(1-7)]|nr:hypothetical protein [Polyangiaceae bacterium LLY-WYZ-15_(1-7)]